MPEERDFFFEGALCVYHAIHPASDPDGKGVGVGEFGVVSLEDVFVQVGAVFGVQQQFDDVFVAERVQPFEFVACRAESRAAHEVCGEGDVVLRHGGGSLLRAPMAWADGVGCRAVRRMAAF